MEKIDNDIFLFIFPLFLSIDVYALWIMHYELKKETPKRVLWSLWTILVWKEAATYSPALHCSTIGASGLNFSVRNGKRWNPTAITTWYGVDYWRDKTVDSLTCCLVQMLFCCHVTTIQLKVWTWKKVFGQLVVLGFDVTVFTPAPYQRRSLQRPSMEFSSCGWLRT